LDVSRRKSRSAGIGQIRLSQVFPDAEANAEAIRQCTHTGRPLGTAEFVEALEKTVGRILTAQKGGRRPKVANRTNQDLFQFE
jgi:plasmid stabilization system protein ParE